MYPSGWPDEVHYAGSVYTYNHSNQAVLEALASAQNAETQEAWLGVMAYPMDEQGRARIVTDLCNRDHPLTGLGLWILAERISQQALGMSLFASSRLAGLVLTYWLPFYAWAARQGLIVSNLSLHELLSAAYGWQASGCDEKEDLHKLNRSIFGTKTPWGR